MSSFLSGNEAVAAAVLTSGVRMVAGYPGTPSTEVIDTLLHSQTPEGMHVEWSVNEKVAVELACAAGWAGHRALCTMKMSGLNVAFDALIGFAYSGTSGGVVIYVTDDPGATTGMCEQDTRGFAHMAGMVMLEPCSAQESYDMTCYAFTLSEAIRTPVFVRSVTCVAHAHAPVAAGGPVPPGTQTTLVRDIARYTKAGPEIVGHQRERLLRSLQEASLRIAADGLNSLRLGTPGGLGVITVGAPRACLEEAVQIAAAEGCGLSVLALAGTLPFPREEIKSILRHCGVVLVVEEMDTLLEGEVLRLAATLGLNRRIVGKHDGVLRGTGGFTAANVARGLLACLNRPVPACPDTPNAHVVNRPIMPCAGCPHRGTYLALNQAVRLAGYKKEQVFISGDVGCTILGISPPFDTLWTEVAMGSSIPVAAAYARCTPGLAAVATIGDSTFLHGGIPALINAVQHGVPLTVVILDNGWTAMTGMQHNAASTASTYNAQTVSLDALVRASGVASLTIADPYDVAATAEALATCLAKRQGVHAVICRRECAIAAGRRAKQGRAEVDTYRCIRCRACVRLAGCPALTILNEQVAVDAATCNGCGTCRATCPHGAIRVEG